MTDFTMPSLGADMEEATFVEWKVAPGDVVKRGDIVCVIETQKGAVDVEIWEGGTIAELVARPGDVIPVGGLLARLSGGEPAVAREPETPAPSASPPGSDRPAQAPAPTPAPPPESRRPVSPAARRRAQELGVSLSTLTGTGPDGVITLEDVERAAASGATAKAPDASISSGAAGGGMRSAIAAAMSRSKREIPHYYLGHEIRLDAALDWLTRFNAERPIGERVLFAALALKAVACALRDSPDLNGHFADGAFRPGSGIHVGVAVALRGGGLIAPALHDADRLPLPEFMAGLKDLLQRARGGQLRSSELTDATITVTNLGDLGVDAVYGVIHPPQVALVGLGKPAGRPWVEGDRVIVARTLHATLSADHRASDGMAGARFLATLDHVFQEPEALA